MSFPKMTARYYKRWSDWYHGDISYPQLLVSHVATNYKLRPSGSGWWADGCKWPDNCVKTHSPSTIKSLLKRGLLEGNSRGEKVAVGDLNKNRQRKRLCCGPALREERYWTK